MNINYITSDIKTNDVTIRTEYTTSEEGEGGSETFYCINGIRSLPFFFTRATFEI